MDGSIYVINDALKWQPFVLSLLNSHTFKIESRDILQCCSGPDDELLLHGHSETEHAVTSINLFTSL